ncbi:MAG: 5,10-methylenetetrahydrofolate reductase [uncultured Rubrobacteraceae bacterium]|uniref:Methylenetetrahydrofolate reductase n=1 Tax=uncultured Rubrobacteraceae bacterium TaxID=349277 RepID=A0A6J4QQA3_9ACTN|nr:MAG: 5,10-methylenetetrahydrofolate reductase [uncultured Rubrobacteraceae bacterium]
MPTQQSTEERQRANRRLAGFLRHPGYEVIPLQGTEESVVEHVPKDVALTVTASPGKGTWATVELAERLAGHGFGVAPHLSARLIRDRLELGEILQRLREAGIRNAFVVAGDIDEPAGEFEDATGLLEVMSEIGHDLDEVGITGYPESHPKISDEMTIQAMYEKAPYATYIISQICFDPEVTSDWARRVWSRGVKLPIRVGMPGYVNRQKLVRISAGIGLGESARFLHRQRNWLVKLLLPGGYSPDRLIEGLKPGFADPNPNIQGLHIYTFNELEQTEAWRRKMLQRAELSS